MVTWQRSFAWPKAFPKTPVRARPIGRRTFEIVEGDWVHERFDFPREGFVRLGSRLAARVE